MGRDLEGPVPCSYIRGEIWRELFGAFITGEGCGGSCLKLLYSRRDLKEAVWSFYNWGGILRCLFGALIFEEGYYKE